MMVKQKITSSISSIGKNNMYSGADIHSPKRISIRKYNGWIFSVPMMPNGRVLETWKNDYKRMVSTFTEIIANMYMLNYKPTFGTSDTKFSMSDICFKSIDYYRSMVIDNARKVMRKSGKDILTCRLVGNHYSFILIINANSVDLDNTDLMFTTLLFNDYDLTCKCCVDVERRIADNRTLARMYNSPFYLARKDLPIENTLRDNMDIHTTDFTTVNLIHECLRCMMEESIIENDVYKASEMYFVQRIIRSLKREFWPIDIRNWICNDRIPYTNDDLSRETLNTVNMLTNQNYNKFPLIDLNSREMKFIMEYLTTQEYVSSDGNKVINLLPYLTNIPYSNTFRYPITCEDGTIVEIIGAFILDDVTNSLRMIIMQDIKMKDMIVFSTMDYKNIEEFNHTTSCVAANTTVLLKNFNIMPSSLSELENIIPKLFIDVGAIDKIIYNLIATYVVLHDRPDRTRMISCTTHTAKGVSKGKKEYKHQSDIVIARILKSTRDAKKYVARMNAEGNGIREYTLESWNRKGYYRRSRDGNSIWVPPTTCHRHLPLTEKEIHIKL